MSMLSSRQPLLPSWPALPDWSDLMARLESRPVWTSLEGHMIRVEERLEKGTYTLRAELPGVDPAKDVDISVREGQLTIKAERSERKEEGTRSEFHYGSFYRSVPLPAGAKEDAIEATYTDGILTVSVPVSESETPEKHIAIKKTAGNGHS
ncbi:Hsp20/alpha crystallin family protein [Nocardia abscessus]|uniref:Hsp20/alpha crystallin family protein n=1 Tax=Nocardia TaxID=1817 RepID=UPI0018956060|nr:MULTISPECIES: Hsp20/alpha crystallin family protein [Nocardia]MBF6223416.1 Hsp20/alpha crystallin family protein [Nocardia abscessus]MDE1675363.1 Hsp20/alpha crystallin family protein [Nocardia gipuzkoensis]